MSSAYFHIFSTDDIFGRFLLLLSLLIFPSRPLSFSLGAESDMLLSWPWSLRTTDPLAISLSLPLCSSGKSSTRDFNILKITRTRALATRLYASLGFIFLFFTRFRKYPVRWESGLFCFLHEVLGSCDEAILKAMVELGVRDHFVPIPAGIFTSAQAGIRGSVRSNPSCHNLASPNRPVLMNCLPLLEFGYLVTILLLHIQMFLFR